MDLIQKWGRPSWTLLASSNISKLPDPFCIIPAVTLSPNIGGSVSALIVVVPPLSLKKIWSSLITVWES